MTVREELNYISPHSGQRIYISHMLADFPLVAGPSAASTLVSFASNESKVTPFLYKSY
jgi:hypothetical protein